MTRTTPILFLFAAGLVACGEDIRDANAEPVIPDVEAESSSSGAPATTDEVASSDDGPDVRLDLPPSDESSTAAGDENCAAFSATGAVVQKPADIIVVVDNSPSMVDETNAVQENLNEFSQQIVGAGIDIRVLLMTAYPDPNAAEQIDTGVCIDPPLGGGGCPLEDDNQPIFAHMQQIIGSEHALAKILSTHDNWKPMMRPDSVKHIIVVTDDDSYISAAEFDEQFRALDPSYADYVLHGIVSTSDCAQEGAIGEQYLALAEMTGGVIGDLCDQQFQPTFDVLSTAVTSGTTLACEWPMPEAPEGKTIDPDSVSILLEIDGEVIAPPQLGGPDECVAGEHGWYFDDPEEPTTLIACPTTCDAVTAAAAAELDIDVGCASFPAG